jgi:hypothetical protein
VQKAWCAHEVNTPCVFTMRGGWVVDDDMESLLGSANKREPNNHNAPHTRRHTLSRSHLNPT